MRVHEFEIGNGIVCAVLHAVHNVRRIAMSSILKQNKKTKN